MRLPALALALAVVLVTPGAQGTSVPVQMAGSADASSVEEHLSISFEQDFSGTYGVATFAGPDFVMTAYLDCVWVSVGEQKGTGEIAGSGLVTSGPLPLLRPVTFRIIATLTGGSLGLAGVRGTGSTCGAEAVPMKAGYASALVTL